MRTVRLCAIIALGMALGYAFENASAVFSDLLPSTTIESSVH